VPQIMPSDSTGFSLATGDFSLLTRTGKAASNSLGVNTATRLRKDQFAA
jgi:hypothetical protein